MSDVTPEPAPDWLANPQPEFPSAPPVVALAAVELHALPPDADSWLTPEEKARAESMTKRRAAGFLGVRLGCKHLARILVAEASEIPDWNRIKTIRGGDGRPVCPLNGNEDALACSASHDSRFAFVAVGTRNIGIDVEMADERAMKGADRFLDSTELGLIPADVANARMVAARLWTIKEAACKLLGIGLVDGWRDVKVLRTGSADSIASSPDGMLSALHAVVDEHIFTIVSML